jgi:enoyl-CoA hydratase/carnithine racemase
MLRGAIWSVVVETLEIARSQGIVTITLNRPQRKNAINGQMWLDLAAVFAEIHDSPDDRCVVITGAGGAFCSGADLGGGGTGGGAGAGGSVRPKHQLAAMRDVNAVCVALHNLPQPTIAKVTGVAAGAGANMALGCDLIVATPESRFSEIFARRGLSIDFGGSWLLPRLVGLHRAKELALLADIISAAEAERMGLVNRIVPADEIDAFVGDWARRLADGPPIALAQTKSMLNASFESSLEQALAAEGMAQTVNFSTRDTAEAMKAFVEKRPPIFEGR